MSDKTVLQIVWWVLFGAFLFAALAFLLNPLAGLLFLLGSILIYNVVIIFNPRIAQVLREDRQNKRKRFLQLFRRRDKEIKPPGPSTFMPEYYLVCSTVSPPIRYHVVSESTVIGRDVDCDLRLTGDASVGARHCRITYRSHSRKYYVEDLRSKIGTFLGFKRLEPNAPEQLFDEAEINISSYRLKFTKTALSQSLNYNQTFMDSGDSGPTMPGVMGVRLTLSITFGVQVRSETVVVGSQFLIGRASECALVLKGDDHVGRRHALLFAENGIVKVADQNSTNGTFLNGERVPQGGSGGQTGVTLGNNDELKVGRHSIIVTY